MDFKVGGTEKGITAIQVDIKVDGLSYKIIKEAFERTRKARKYILEEVMLKQLDKPRAEISEYAAVSLETDRCIVWDFSASYRGISSHKA